MILYKKIVKGEELKHEKNEQTVETLYRTSAFTIRELIFVVKINVVFFLISVYTLYNGIYNQFSC